MMSSGPAMARQANLELLFERVDVLRAARDGNGGPWLRRGAVEEVLLPVLDGRGLLTIQPQLGKRLARGAEKLCNHVGRVEDVLVCGVIRQRCRRSHDVTVDVAAAAESGGTGVSDCGDYGFQIVLAHTMNLHQNEVSFEE